MSMFDHKILAELEKRINKNGRSVRAIALEVADLYGVSESTAYRQLADAGIYRSGRTSPKKGARKCGITDKELNLIIARKSGRVRVSKSGVNTIRVDAMTKKNQCSSWQAVDELFEAGLINQRYHERTVNRLIRERGASLRQQREPQPFTDMVSLNPNHVWQYDTTWCKQVYLPDGKFYVADPEGIFYRNKLTLPKDGRMIYRFVMVDHFSSSFRVRYYPAENNICFRDFFYECCRGMDDHRHPLHGVPQILVTDKAPEVREEITQKILKRLGVEHMAHFPMNSRAKGAVETCMHAWERWFESKLAFQPATSLDELNAWADEHCIKINTERPLHRHNVAHEPRAKIYLDNLKPEHIRELPSIEVLNQLAHKARDCKVKKNGLIEFKGNEYRIGAEYTGMKITVEWCPYDYPDVQVNLDGKLIKLSPVSYDAVGRRTDRAAVWGREYKSQKQTPTIKSLKAAAGANLKDFRPFSQVADGKVRYMSAKGTPIEVEVEERFIRRADAEVAIFKTLNRGFTDDERGEIDALPEFVPEKDVAEMIGRFRAAERQRIIGGGAS